MSLEEDEEDDAVAELQWAGDRSRLLPGELPETLYGDDADHWIRVYKDLVTFHADVIDNARRRLARADGAGGGGQPDLILLQAHLDRLRARLGFWEQRAVELAAGASRSASQR